LNHSGIRTEHQRHKPALKQRVLAFRRGWETQIGATFPLPTFSPATTDDFRVKSRAVKVRDVAITDVHSASALRTAGTPFGYEDHVWIYVVRRGTWTLDDPHGRGEQTASAGQFLLRHGRPARLSVSELAAYWQFADSSHFIRAFKKHHGPVRRS
jgi:AraC-like DNA-binding protein